MGLYYQPGSQEQDSSGDSLGGAKLFFYEVGTATKKTVYTDKALTIPHTNPVVADAAGRFAAIYTDGAYKVVLSDSTDTDPPTSPIDTNDDVSFGASGDFFSETVAISTTTAIDATFEKKHLRCTGTISLNLLAAGSAGEGFMFSLKNDGTGIVTIDPNSSEQINDSTTIKLRPGSGGLVICDGSEWSFTGFEALHPEAKGADVASATALDISAVDGNYFDVTGTTTITSITTTGFIGSEITLHFDGILTLTHDATNLVLPGAANITTAAGDEFTFREYADGDYRCIGYALTSGKAIVTTPPGLTLLGTYTASADTSVDIGSGLDVDAAIDDTYDEYIITVSNLVAATDNVAFYARTSTDGGSAFDSGAGNYEHGTHGFTSNAVPTAQYAGSASATEISTTPNFFTGNAAGESFNATISLHAPAGTNETQITWDATFTASAGTTSSEKGIGARLSAANVDAIRLFMASGNITSGEFKLYGVKKS